METRNIDSAICPNCMKKFHPRMHVGYERDADYFMDCPHCGVEVEVFESIEYVVTLGGD